MCSLFPNASCPSAQILAMNILENVVEVLVCHEFPFSQEKNWERQIIYKFDLYIRSLRSYENYMILKKRSGIIKPYNVFENNQMNLKMPIFQGLLI